MEQQLSFSLYCAYDLLCIVFWRLWNRVCLILKLLHAAIEGRICWAIKSMIVNTHRYKVFATRKEPRGGYKNTPEENLQYLGSLMSDFDEIFTVYSQMNLAYNRIKIFELPLWMTS